MIKLFGRNKKSNDEGIMQRTADIASTDELNLTDIPDISSVGGELNLIRAIYDEADEVVKKIDRTIVSLDNQKEHLLKLKETYEKMIGPATDYIAFVNNNKNR